MRLVVITNINKPKVRPAMEEIVPWIKQRADVVAVDDEAAIDLTTVDADAVLVLGGDGTLLATARRLAGRQLPVMGVNFGRLGFLASFAPAELKTHFDAFVAGTLPISSRQTLEVSVVDATMEWKHDDATGLAEKRRWTSTSLNDAVITAGAPFRMIELNLGTDGEAGVRYFGDGVIVATPSGSTAYNVAAGGPIISPGIDCICITPLAPQSLSFRPVIQPASSTIVITAIRVNRGTTLFCDGQASSPLKSGDRVVLRRFPRDLLLVENPAAREWRTLAEKLNWAASPSFNSTVRPTLP